MKKPVFLKQKNMLRVLYSLFPIAVSAVYFFGLRVLAILAISFLFAFLTEWFMESRKNGKVSYAVFVTAALYGLSLPATTPFWIVAVGVIVGVLFGKACFGGFGKNIFNPAIVGRAFVYVAFPIQITGSFTPVFKQWPGGFTRYSITSGLPDYLAQANITITDAITAATPMWARRDFGFLTDLKSLFLGNIGGIFTSAQQPHVLAAGSIGEVSALLIILSSIYLIGTKTAQWRLTISTLLGAVAFNLILKYLFGVTTLPSIPFTLFSGALLYGAVFMVTDPVSAPKLPLSQWIYGLFIGAMVVFFRHSAIFAGGLAFAMLLGNMLAPSFDMWIKRYRTARAGGGK